MTTSTLNVQIHHPIDRTPVGGAHIVPAFPGGHSNTALCGAPITGRLRVVKTSTCAQCAREAN